MVAVYILSVNRLEEETFTRCLYKSNTMCECRIVVTPRECVCVCELDVISPDMERFRTWLFCSDARCTHTHTHTH